MLFRCVSGLGENQSRSSLFLQLASSLPRAINVAGLRSANAPVSFCSRLPRRCLRQQQLMLRSIHQLGTGTGRAVSSGLQVMTDIGGHTVEMDSGAR